MANGKANVRSAKLGEAPSTAQQTPQQTADYRAAALAAMAAANNDIGRWVIEVSPLTDGDGDFTAQAAAEEAEPIRQCPPRHLHTF